MAISPGKRLGRYEVRSQIGAGGMGEVYLALDTELDRRVAIKILPGEVAADKNRMRRFTQEAKTASALNHPNILTIYEIGHADSTHFIVTEFIEGETLRQHMRGARMKLSEVLSVAIQAADALAAAHEVGIIHRDIKPENIMLRKRDAYVKVLDFGVAKLTEQQPATTDTEAPTKTLFKTDEGVVVGTVIYMSPEQARGLEVDARTDIWSLGVVLYEMVAGCLPFEGSTTSEILVAIINEKAPPPLARFARDVPAELERIVEKALRKDREQRYQTIRDLMLDLQSLKQKLEFEAKLERSMPPELKSGAAAVAAAPSAVETITKPVRSSTSKIEALTGPMKLRLRGVILAGAVLMLVAVTLFYALLFRNAPATPQPEIKSLAVLPLENLSGDPTQDYFADGMTEAVIAELAKISALRKVISRTSMMQYKGTRKPMPQIARELNVDALVEGSIVRLGDRVRITVKLYAAKDEQPLWTETYQRNLRDILALQSELGQAIANEIRVKLTPQERGLLANAKAVNPEAHEAYLKGLQFFNQGINERREDLLKRSVDYLEQAIRIEPDYGLAHAQLARSYHWLGGWSPEFYPKAKAEAIKALQIDETLAQAHSALGFTIFRLDWDWSGAEKEFKRAIDLNPGYSEAHHAYALYLSAAGRHDEAIAEIKRGQELDPLTLPGKVNLGITYLHARQYDVAIEQFRNTLDVNPDNPGLHTSLGVAYVYKGMYEESIAEFQKVIALSKGDARIQANAAWVYVLSGKAGGDPRKKGNLAWAYAMAGKRSEAISILAELKEPSKQAPVAPITMASIYAALGDKDKAIEWLQKVYEDHSWVILYINCYPEFDSLRSDPRFQDLMRRVGLPQ